LEQAAVDDLGRRVALPGRQPQRQTSIGVEQDHVAALSGRRCRSSACWDCRTSCCSPGDAFCHGSQCTSPKRTTNSTLSASARTSACSSPASGCAASAAPTLALVMGRNATRRPQAQQSPRMVRRPPRISCQVTSSSRPPQRRQCGGGLGVGAGRSEEHTSELQSLTNLVCRLLLEKKNAQRERPNTERTS